MHNLFRVVAIPVNDTGAPLHNQFATQTVARAAVRITGVVAAAWTQGTVEVLINARDEEAALDVVDYAANTLRNDADIFVVDGEDISFLAGLANQVSELTGIPSHGTSVEPHGKARGMLWNEAVRFETDGLTSEGLIAAMTGVVSER